MELEILACLLSPYLQWKDKKKIPIFVFNIFYVFNIYLSFQTKVKIVPVLGTGLLIGTALAVIIPEGVHVMYSNHHSHGK